MIHLHQYIPAPLRNIVKSFWCLNVSTPACEAYQERIVPDGHHELIFHVKKKARRTDALQQWHEEPAAIIAGQTTRSHELVLEDGALLYGIRFYPHTLAPLLRLPAAEYTNKLIGLNDVAYGSVFSHALNESHALTFQHLEQLLVKMMKTADYHSHSFQYINYCVHQILACNGLVKIDRLVADLPISIRYLDQLFQRFVGLSPKMFCNQVRLQNYLHYKSTFPHRTLTDCAYEAGYFDQAHATRFFKTVTGILPKDYFKTEHVINTHFAGM